MALSFFRRKGTSAEDAKKAADASQASGAPVAGGASNGAPGSAGGAGQRDMRKAKRFFEHAHSVADHDYAIECFINGLQHDPGNMDEHTALHDVALRRKVAGGKPPSLGEKMKSGGRDPLERFLHAERLWAKDPLNRDLMIAVMELAVEADKAEADVNLGEVAYWVGEKILAFQSRKPMRSKDLIKVGDLFAAVGRFDRACDALKLAVHLERPSPSPELLQKLKNYDTERTMQEGGYDRAADKDATFKTSVRDQGVQKDLHNQESLSKPTSVVDEMIERRRADLAEAPQDLDRIRKLVEALIQKESEAEEEEAIGLLQRAYDQSKEYHYKLRMDDVRMKQLNRQARALRAAAEAKPDDAALREEYETLLRLKQQFELDAYTDRAKQYPTDMKVRFELGQRLFQNGRYEDAIGAFQQSKADPKVRAASNLFLGRCYLAQGWTAEALDTLRKGIDAHAHPDDTIGMEMRYHLMETLYVSAEKNRDVEQAREAQKIASQIVQANISYRDIRQWMEKIRKLIDELGK